jgi:hypothetical protein
MELLEDRVVSESKYPYELVSGLDEVEFYMVPDNATKVSRRLDEIRAKQPKFVCLNDDMNKTGAAPVETVKALHDFYVSYFPAACPFENPDDRPNDFLYVDDWRARKAKQQREGGGLFSTFSSWGGNGGGANPNAMQSFASVSSASSSSSASSKPSSLAIAAAAAKARAEEESLRAGRASDDAAATSAWMMPPWLLWLWLLFFLLLAAFVLLGTDVWPRVKHAVQRFRRANHHHRLN